MVFVIEPPKPDQRTVLYERFRKVILLAGYKNPQRILDEHFEEYFKNIPEFEKMLKSYEDNDGDPD